ncbi:MAG: hypothetical protein JOZ42_17755 [Acetobacteraceae bacterium]|nr:hypothetical protein [Acetobacteraceae bacterium]
MRRQHSAPVLLTSNPKLAQPLKAIRPQNGNDALHENCIQELIHGHPECLPIAEIDSVFVEPVPICTELNTPAGPIDNFMVTVTGLPVLIECKLWRNPEGRREVIAQILDYAKEFSRWSSSDVQREVNRRLKRNGNALLDLVRADDPAIDEAQFNDNLTANLRRGRFLLLIVGDGIREGTEAIAEYLQMHAGLHFSLGLVELPFYALPDGGRLVTPRVLARTALMTRTIVKLPEGYSCVEGEDAAQDTVADPERDALANDYRRFWEEFLRVLQLDDPEQPAPKQWQKGSMFLVLPAPENSLWLMASRGKDDELRVFLTYTRNTPGEYAIQVILADWERVRKELGGTATLAREKPGRLQPPMDSRVFHQLASPEIRQLALAWLAERVNTFVNVLRPLVRSAVAEYRSHGE